MVDIFKKEGIEAKPNIDIFEKEDIQINPNQEALKVKTMGDVDNFYSSPVGEGIKYVNNMSWDNTINSEIEDYKNKQDFINNNIPKEKIKEWENKGAIGWTESFKKLDKWKTVPFGSTVSAVKDVNVLRTVNKIKNNEEVSEEERQTVDDYISDMAELQTRGMTFGGKIATYGSQMPAFALEFMALGGLGKIGKTAATKATGAVLEKAILSEGITGTLARTTQTASGLIASGAARSLGMPNRYVEGYAERRINDGLAVTDKGQVVLTDSTEKPLTSFMKAYSDVFIENVSEEAGVVFLGKAVDLGITKAASFLPTGVRTALFEAYRKIKPDASVREMFSKAGFQGVITELGEERIGDVLRVGFGLDERKDISTFQKLEDAIFPDKEQLALELGLFSIMGGASIGASKLKNILTSQGKSPQEIETVITGTSQLEKENIIDNFTQPLKDAGNKFYQEMIDSLDPINALQKKLIEANPDVKTGKLPYLLARESKGSIRQAESFITSKVYDIDENGKSVILGEGLEPILQDFDFEFKRMEKDQKIRREDLSEYLKSTRILQDLINREDVNVSESQKEAAIISLDNVRSKYGKRADLLPEYAKRIYDFQKNTLSLLVKGGLMSQEKYDNILEKNPHYIPFYRVLEEGEIPDFQVGVGTKPKFTKARDITKKITGSERDIKDVYESMIYNTMRIVDNYTRNKVAKSVADAAEFLPDDIKKVKPNMTKINMEIKKTNIVSNQDKINIIKENIPDIISQDKLDVAKEKLSKLEGQDKLDALGYIEQLENGAKPYNIYNYISKYQTDDFMIMFDKAVLNRKYSISEKEIIETFRPSAFAPKGNIIEYRENGERKFIEVEKSLYNALTSMNEEQTSFVMKMLAVPTNVLRFGATIIPEFMLRNIVRDQHVALLQSKGKFIPFLDTVKALASVVKKDDLYYDWIRSGGAYSSYMDLSDKGLEKAYDRLLKDKSKFRFLNPITTLQETSIALEEATRVAIFKRSKERGLSDLEAGLASREATLDFSRSGTKGKKINQIIAFFNAGVQSADKMVRTFKERPVAATAWCLGTITMPSLAITGYYLFGASDEDREEYLNLPRWRKDMFWNIKVNGTWISYPKPFALGYIFGSMPERFLEYTYANDKSASKDILNNLFSVLTPIQDFGSIIPTGLKTPIEWISNYNFFTGRNIVPEWMENIEPSKQAVRNTTETSKLIGEVINKSPAKIDNLLRGTFAGLSKYITDTGDFLINSINEEKPKKEKELGEYPVVKAFVSLRPEGMRANETSDFMDNVNTLSTINSTFNYLKRNDVKAAKAYYEENKDKIILYSKSKKYYDAILDTNKLIKAVEDKGGDLTEKQIKIDNLMKKIVNYAEQGNILIEEK